MSLPGYLCFTVNYESVLGYTSNESSEFLSILQTRSDNRMLADFWQRFIPQQLSDIHRLLLERVKKAAESISHLPGRSCGTGGNGQGAAYLHCLRIPELYSLIFALLDNQP